MGWFDDYQLPQGPFQAWMSGQSGVPADSPYSPSDYGQARSNMMLQLGMGLLGAAQPMTGAQRAQILMGLPQAMTGMRQDLRAGLEDRMLQQKLQGWKQFQGDVQAGKYPDMPPGMMSLVQSMGPDAGMQLYGQYLLREPTMQDWATVNTAQGVFAYDKNNPGAPMKRLGDLPKTKGQLGDEITQDAMQMHTQYMTETNLFADLNDTYSNLKSVQGADSVSDNARAFAFLRLVNPNRRIVTGADAVAATDSLPEVMQRSFNNVFSGGVFTPEERASVMRTADTFYTGYRKHYDAQRAQALGTAQQYGWPEWLFPDRTVGVGMPQQQAPDNPFAAD